MPYRIDLRDPPDEAFDVLVALGALDVDVVGGVMAALLPDAVPPSTVARALGVNALTVSHAIGRDEGSTWLLRPRAAEVGGVRLVPADLPAPPGAIRLSDGVAFGTGLHPTTALCLEALDEVLRDSPPRRMLDVGTGSGVLALAALVRGVEDVIAIDIDLQAVQVAAENARLNTFEGRLRFVAGGPEAVAGAWPLVVANLLPAPLVEMAPTLVRRVGAAGRLILSGIPASMAPEVERAYRWQGLRPGRTETRAGWTRLVFQAAW